MTATGRLDDATPTTDDVVHLTRAGVSVVARTGGGRLPRIVHWGRALGALTPEDLSALVDLAEPPMSHNPNDQVWDVSVLPEFEAGWVGRPGVEGSRGGRDWSPAFRTTAVSVERDVVASDGRRVDRIAVDADDAVAALGLFVEIELLHTGLLRLRATITNHGEPYTVGALRLVVPVPAEADELLDFTGRHIMERVPQRSEFPVGLHSREQRGGRTGLDAASLLIAGRSGFGWRAGEVWGTHVAWSGNQAIYAERIANGGRVLGGGELLQQGEVVLGAGEDHAGPWFYGSYADGLDRMAARFHEHVRAGRAYPASPRRVVVNSWEAVYFDHDLEILGDLVDRAAALGVERFVLDDGWFGSRRDDRSGLGDWTVSPEVWPSGLTPLIDRVHAAGLDFGLWVEPEMVNLDSDLARAHPDWVFSAGGRTGFASRNQHVLDLTNPDAFAHIRGALLRLLDEYDIAYLKWDHNRQLVEAGHQPDGRPAIHGQTLAVYRLMDELRAAHPTLEIESCASGSGRVDLGILEHTQRVWGSDTNDPLERQQIHRSMKLLVPPELIGAHVGASPSHTTGRTHALGFRAETAVWCHLGVELDLRATDPAEVDELREWVAFHRAHRDLLHRGVVVNADHPDDAIWVSGVVADDGSEALYGVAAIRRSVSWPPGALRLPGLLDDADYRVSIVSPGTVLPHGAAMPRWVAEQPTVRGTVLAAAGLQIPPIWPEQALIIRAERI